MKNAALYLRSSKDKADVSISAQRQELQQLARTRGLSIVAEFSDVVLSGKDENRAGFQAMSRAINDPRRGWDHLLILDTSRLSRARYVGEVFSFEADKRGVRIIYAKVPDQIDPITEIIVTSVFRAMDVVHSMMSRDKGLAGMRENLRLGYRPAGNAPFGYRLKKVETGAVREGKPVTKSVLELDERAPTVQRYLKRRAAGISRAAAKAESGIGLADTSLIGVEWNALTYAGCTTMNRYTRRVGAAYAGAMKRQPRKDWQIKTGTHPALITMDEAEAILSALERKRDTRAISEAMASTSPYLLSGILVTPAGTPWRGEEGKYYRASRPGQRGVYISAQAVEKAVLTHLVEELNSEVFHQAVVRWAHDSARIEVRPQRDLQKRLQELAGQVDRAMALAVQLDDPGPALRKVDALENERKRIAGELEHLRAEQAQVNALATITPAAVRDLLRGLAEDIGDRDPEQLKLLVRSMVQQVVMDPDTFETEVEYRLRAKTPLGMALLRVCEDFPVLRPRSKFTFNRQREARGIHRRRAS